MDFSKASLAELRQFTKDNGIKGCSGMKKAELAQFLIKYVEEHVTAVSVEIRKMCQSLRPSMWSERQPETQNTEKPG